MCNYGCNRGFLGIDDQTIILILVFWFFFCTGGNLCGGCRCNAINDGCGNDCGCNNGCGC